MAQLYILTRWFQYKLIQLTQESTSLAGAGVDAKGQCQQDHGFGVCWAQLG